MITEDYVSFEVAKLLKEKGFNVPVWTRYEDDEDKDVIFGDKYDWNSSPMGQTSTPTHQMAMKWLREVHNIYIDIAPTHSTNGPIHFIWQTYNSDYLVTGDCDIFYPTYEQAVEAALKYALENLL